MRHYHIWTVGCQMNKADSERMGAALEQLGLSAVDEPADADVVVLNSCVVRQNAEDRVVGMLTSLKPWKQSHPDRTIALMGCMVGPQQDGLRKQFPYVDTFMRPQQFDSLIRIVAEKQGVDPEGCVGPLVPGHPRVTIFVPISHGCDKFCTFCIIPYRRGRDVSRPFDDLVDECKMLAARGVKEVTLLGQNVDSYGHDLPGKPDLADLLTAIHERVPELSRIRFLTSHPNDMSQRIIEAVARLPRVMEFINLPFQAGDDMVLANMRRGYTNAQYRELVGRIRATIPNVAMVTDLIVGFPGETEEQFERTLELVRDLRFDKVHGAAYSVRPGTIAARQLPDDVPQAEKERRLRAVEALQERILSEINAGYFGTTQEVLVDGHHRGRWQGRTRTDKLVFIESDEDLAGRLVSVRITKTSPWSLQGRLARSAEPVSTG
ncbi:MAG: tRNA (N6-isopentenyl adenosine(37)-C2)-methylthiotransferase MiaB [SAR202 cluster bacterium]|nr:tRNA (N6-isopentenyl adenosine(37)-C2)-methylthiotransferase MiaB [SAR202 cluster bacterium]